jgi:hypothetical protein
MGSCGHQAAEPNGVRTKLVVVEKHSRQEHEHETRGEDQAGRNVTVIAKIGSNVRGGANQRRADDEAPLDPRIEQTSQSEDRHCRDQ